ncbi:MAG: hypothetical protein AAF721_41780, partial [Myxococcota bacterium]
MMLIRCGGFGLAAGLLTVVASMGACTVEDANVEVDERDLDEEDPAEPSTFAWTCEQLDLDQSDGLDFGDFLVISELFEERGVTPTGLPVDFALFLELSGRFGEVCDFDLHAPLRYTTAAEIDAGAVPTIFEQLAAEGVELDDAGWEQAFGEEGLFGIVRDSVALHPGDVLEVGETTLDDVNAAAAAYNENGVAYQLRHFEAMVTHNMYMPGDAVHEELRELYLGVAAGAPLPPRRPPEEASTCNASCGVTLWKQPRHFDAVAGHSCKHGYARVTPEVDVGCVAEDPEDFDDEATMAYARTSCTRDAMAGLHCAYSPGCRHPQHCEADLGVFAGETVKNGSINEEPAEIESDTDSAEAYARGEALAYAVPLTGAPATPGEPVKGRTEARDISCDTPHALAEWTWSILNGVVRPIFADLVDHANLPSWTIDAAIGYTLQHLKPPGDTDTCNGTLVGETTVHYLASRSTDMPKICGEGDACEDGYVCVDSLGGTRVCVEDPAEVAPERRYQPIWSSRRALPLVRMRAQARGRALVTLPADDGEIIDVGGKAKSHAAARANFWVKDLQAVGAGTSCAHWAPGDERYDSLFDRAV